MSKHRSRFIGGHLVVDGYCESCDGSCEMVISKEQEKIVSHARAGGVNKSRNNK